MQLMQQSVQKSSTTTLPRRSFSRTGPAVLSQAVPPSSSGAFMGLRFGSSGGSARLRRGESVIKTANKGRQRRDERSTLLKDNGVISILHGGRVRVNRLTYCKYGRLQGNTNLWRAGSVSDRWMAWEAHTGRLRSRL